MCVSVYLFICVSVYLCICVCVYVRMCISVYVRITGIGLPFETAPVMLNHCENIVLEILTTQDPPSPVFSQMFDHPLINAE